MLATVLALSIVAAVLVAGWLAARSLERCAATLSGLRPADWQRRGAELRGAAQDVAAALDRG